MVTPVTNPMKAMVLEQAVPQIDMLVKVFEGQMTQSVEQKKVLEAAIQFRDALKEWANA